MGVAVGWGTVMFDDRFEILCDCLCVFTCFDYSVMCKLITEEYNRMRHARVIKNTARRVTVTGRETVACVLRSVKTKVPYTPITVHRPWTPERGEETVLVGGGNAPTLLYADQSNFEDSVGLRTEYDTIHTGYGRVDRNRL